MSANTTYYAKVPKITYEWIQVSALVADDVREQYPDAIEVLHWSQYEEEVEQQVYSYLRAIVNNRNVSPTI